MPNFAALFGQGKQPGAGLLQGLKMDPLMQAISQVTQDQPAFDPAGFKIDLTRPIVEGKDKQGRRVFHTELGTGVNDQRLNEGRPTNIPSVINGQIIDTSTREGLRLIIEDAVRRQTEGWVFPHFDTHKQAETASKARSARINELRRPGRQ